MQKGYHLVDKVLVHYGLIIYEEVKAFFLELVYDFDNGFTEYQNVVSQFFLA